MKRLVWLGAIAVLTLSPPALAADLPMKMPLKASAAAAVSWTGWTGGGGIETLLWDNWLARLEYRYADYGTWRTAFGPPAELIVNDFAVTTHSALLGYGRKF